MPIEEFKAVDWKPFRKAFLVLFGAKRITSLDAGAGWRPLLWDLCVALEAHAKVQVANGNRPVQVVQIKQKLGGLRFYVHGGDDLTRAFIDAAEEIAERTCEVCGDPAEAKRINGWISVFCRAHQEVALDWAIREQNRGN